MAKRKTAKIDVSGLSTQDIVNLDANTINKLSRADLSKLTSRLVSSANKRLRRLEKTGNESLAYQSAMSSGGVFSTKGKNVNELRKEFARASKFIEQKTSTVKGARDYDKFISGYVPEGSEKQFWEVVHRLEEVDKNFFNTFYKQIMGMISETVTDNPNNALDIALERYNALYEQKESEFIDITNTEFSDEFENPFT